MKNIVIHFAKFWIVILFISCNTNVKNSENQIIQIFHAGSLSLPMKILKDSFEKQYPNYKLLLQACGSKQCVRNITDLNKNWDAFFSADKWLIDSFLIPKHSNKAYPFVSNEMVIAFTNKSKFHNEINENNWFEILAKPEVTLAFSHPLTDPCGVRAISVLTLAEKIYKKELLSSIRYKKNVLVRPKEVDIVSLLELGNIDYTIIYKSIALQYCFNFIDLSDSLNLSNPLLKDWYSKHYIKYEMPDGKIKAENITLIEYGYCINKKSENKKSVGTFIDFVSSNKAKEIMKQMGHSILY